MTGNDICKAIQENGLGDFELDFCNSYGLGEMQATLAFLIANRPTKYVAMIQDEPIRELSYGFIDIYRNRIRCRKESYLSDDPKEFDN